MKEQYVIRAEVHCIRFLAGTEARARHNNNNESKSKSRTEEMEGESGDGNFQGVNR